MPSQSLKDLAVQIRELSFRDMMEFSEGLSIASCRSGVSKADQILIWAEGVTAPPVPVEPPNDDSIAEVNPTPFEMATDRSTQ